MKSEFVLAFNEITELRGLSKDVVMDALRTALVSAYRRSEGATAAQRVDADIDQDGKARIFVEKEVVDSVTDRRTEVLLEEARQYDPDAELNDMVMVEVDTSARGFGRIAAQTAKQVILQRIREAEREAQYEEYIEREGEIVNGTVQSVTSSSATIGLGRSEAILPRSQQVPGEIYRPHDKVRAYVLEVRKTNRGPQIIVSRSHRNMLRRLLEYEVPEIYNGQVEIKNIAREAGHRSKVAVAALQDGVDPVGACVGMRGVRIQSIVRELNDEKIDVIEWNPDQSAFIAKALSPARVSGVYLDESPAGGRTATVLVPDDQLSLAIGREGQNARLAAKLTGWRIDIKSVTEASFEAIRQIDEGLPDLQPLAQEQTDLVEEARRILEKKEANRPVMPEEYRTLTQFAGEVEDQILAVRQLEYEAYTAKLEAVRASIPEGAYVAPLDTLALDPVLQDTLTDAGYANVGTVMEAWGIDRAQIAELEEFDEAAIEELQAALETFEVPEGMEMPEEEAEAEPEPEPAAEVEAEAEPEAETEPEPETQEPLPVVGTAAPVSEDEPVPPAFPDVEEPEEELDEIEEEKEEEKEEKKKKAPKRQYVYVEEDIFEDEEDDVDRERQRRKDKRRRRRLVYDEEKGGVIAKRRRKGSRQTDEWEEWVD